MRGRRALLEARDTGRSLLVCGAGLLLLGVAVLLLAELTLELPGRKAWEFDRWRLGA